MADLMFKRGAQPNLPTTAQDGCFYLTTDTNRLYVGNENHELVLLSQNIQLVDSVDALPKEPNANEFYYCSGDNVFAFYDGTDWLQINPDTDTNTDTFVSGASFDEGVTGEDSIVYTLTLNQKVNRMDVETDDEVEDLTAELVIKAEDLASIVPEASEVGLKVTDADGGDGVTIYTDGVGADSEVAVTILPGTNVTSIEADDDQTFTINVKDSTYELSVEAGDGSTDATIALTDTTNSGDLPAGSITMSSDDDINIEVNGDDICISHKEYTAESIELNSDSEDILAPGGAVELITSIGISNGHIESIQSQSFTLPEDTYIDSIDKDGWKAEFKYNREDTLLENPVLDFTEDVEALTQDLQDYVAEELAKANTAMTYKGSISEYNDLLLLSDVEVGDVYLLDDYDGDYDKGDMFIAYAGAGASVENGVISGTIGWSHIPSGDELKADTRFYGIVESTESDETASNADNGSVQFMIRADEDLRTPEENVGVKIIAGRDLYMTDAEEVEGDYGNYHSVLIDHKEYETDNDPENASDVENRSFFTAVTGMTVENGHVTEVSYETFTPEALKLVGENNQLKLVTDDPNPVEKAYVDVEGDTWISATVDEDKLSIAHAGPSADNKSDESIAIEIPSIDDVEPGADYSFDIITALDYDENGHIIGASTGTVTLPTDKDTTYTLSVTGDGNESSPDEVTDPYITLTASDELDTTSVQIVGSENVVATGATNGNQTQVVLSLAWGTF